jgi:NAD+ synthase (glutamine-hydrolysing)
MPPAISFQNLYAHGFIRTAVAVPRVTLADPAANASETVSLVKQAHEQGACVIAFPELGLTGYSCEDLFHQEALLNSALDALHKVAMQTTSDAIVIVVGLPLRCGDHLFNVGVVLFQGQVLGVVPKTYLPNYREFYEARQFTSAADSNAQEIHLDPWGSVPFGTDLLFEMRAGTKNEDVKFTLGVEICEDLWVPVPPSSLAALRGAQVLINLSASPASVGKAEYRRDLVNQQSARCVAAYLFSGAGFGESTTDLAWDGHGMICENGHVLSESERFKTQSQLLLADIDIQRLSQERMRLNTFAANATILSKLNQGRLILTPLKLTQKTKNLDLISIRPRFPYVPSLSHERDARCHEVIQIQVQGLAKRLSASGLNKLVMGVSGGLDSTLGLIVAALALDLLNLPRTHLLAWTLPGFATSARTKDQAIRLMQSLGCQSAEIDIRPGCMQVFKDIGHPYAEGKQQYDITFENVQAGERTSLLFRLANQHGALVVGTSDLSEVALGWSTYGVGDHMAHYHVNASVPKTLVQHLIRWSSENGQWNTEFTRALQDVLTTEISPELVPGNSIDGPSQSTESAIGPYALHDFFLYGLLRFGYTPTKLAWLAQQSWSQGPDAVYTKKEIKTTLHTFLKRFFAGSQFKRSCIANAPKVGSGGSLSPRGDWRAPSDSDATVWLKDWENIPD